MIFQKKFDFLILFAIYYVMLNDGKYCEARMEGFGKIRAFEEISRYLIRSTAGISPNWNNIHNADMKELADITIKLRRIIT